MLPSDRNLPPSCPHPRHPLPITHYPFPVTHFLSLDCFSTFIDNDSPVCRLPVREWTQTGATAQAGNDKKKMAS